jgi:CBS domain-containing protein
MTMILTRKSLNTMTAADLMSTTVVTVPRAMSLRGAAHLLSQADISGAPVVDDSGRCVGVLSATDFIAWADRGEHAARRRPVHIGAVHHSAWQLIDDAAAPANTVGEFMTDDPVMVTPDTPIMTLARMMRDAHIHRLIVVDAAGRPVGIVSTMDILAAVAELGPAVDERW